MIFNIIAYRPDGSDYCRGCLMGTSSSHCETFHTEDVSKAAEFIAKKKFEDHFAEREVRAHEIIIIMDGRVVHNDVDGLFSLETDNNEYGTVADGLSGTVDSIVAYLLQEKEENDEKANHAEELRKFRKAQEDEEKHRAYILNEYNNIALQEKAKLEQETNAKLWHGGE